MGTSSRSRLQHGFMAQTGQTFVEAWGGHTTPHHGWCLCVHSNKNRSVRADQEKCQPRVSLSVARGMQDEDWVLRQFFRQGQLH